MDMLNAPFKRADEFALFNQQMKTLYQRDPAYMNNLVAQLDEQEKKYLKKLLETKRINIQHKGVET